MSPRLYKNYVHSGIKIVHLRSVTIRRYSSKFTDCFSFVSRSIDYFLRIVLGPPLTYSSVYSHGFGS